MIKKESPSLKVNGLDFSSAAGHAVLFALATGAAAAVSSLSTSLADIDLGTWTPVVAVGLAFAGKLLQRWLSDNRK